MFGKIGMAMAATMMFAGAALADPIEGNWKTKNGDTAAIGGCGGSFCIRLKTGEFAGKSIGIGFGARRLNNGRVRKADEKPASPDEYPIRMGVVRVTGRAGQNETVAKLKAALRVR